MELFFLTPVPRGVCYMQHRFVQAAVWYDTHVHARPGDGEMDGEGVTTEILEGQLCLASLVGVLRPVMREKKKIEEQNHTG